MDVMKTGTTTVGVVFKDGVILAADKRATAGNLVVDKKTEKVVSFYKNMALTIAGSVSDVQLLIKILKAELNLTRVRVNRDPTVEETAGLLSTMVYSNIRKFTTLPGVTHFLLGGYDQDGAQLYDIFPDGSLTKIDDFVSSGSGSVFALGVLESNYKKDMKKEEAIELVLKAINSALQRDAFSGNGVDLVVIDKNGVKKEVQKKVNTGIN